MNRTLAVTALTVALLAAALAGCNDVATQNGTPAPPALSTAPPAVVIATPPPNADGVRPAETAKDSAATDPKGTLSKEEESKSMPMAAHGNNHSSPALEAAKK